MTPWVHNLQVCGESLRCAFTFCSGMTTEVTVAVIGFAGAIAGAIIKTFSEELKSLALGRFNRNKDLLGDWECKWTIETPEKQHTISDTVTVHKVAGEKVSATAETPTIGRYRLAGRISESGLVTLTYGGQQDRRFLGGVVILKLNAGRDTLRGHWHECDKEGVFWGGDTTWQKRLGGPAH